MDIHDVNSNSNFIIECDKKLDRIDSEITLLKRDMTEKYKKLNIQFKWLLASIGACLGISLHQFIILAFFKA